MIQNSTLVLIIPAHLRSKADDLSIKLGHANANISTYTAKLQPKGQTQNAEPTHYGCNAVASPGFVIMIEIFVTGNVPEGADNSLIETALALRSAYPDLASALYYRAASLDEYGTAFNKALDELGLQRVIEEWN